MLVARAVPCDLERRPEVKHGHSEGRGATDSGGHVAKRFRQTTNPHGIVSLNYGQHVRGGSAVTESLLNYNSIRF